MGKSSNGIFAFVAGIAAGAAVGYFLNTEEGKEVRKRAMDKLDGLESEFGEKIKTKMDEVTEGLNVVVDEAKAKMDEVRTKMNNFNGKEV